MQQAEADFDPLPFDVSAARALARVAASLRRAGRKPTARAYDAMIAAVAIGKRSATGAGLRRRGVEALGTEGERDSAQAAVRVEVAQLSGHVPNAIAAGQRRQRQRCQHT